MGSALAIYTNIATSTSVFSSSDKKLPRAAICALGPSALGHRLLPSAIFYLGGKNLGLGAILFYIAPADPIYTLHIHLKVFTKILMDFKI